MDSNGIHFAIRVTSYAQALEALRAKGYREDASPDDLMGHQDLDACWIPADLYS
jgi:hypothetical protein